MSSIHDIARSGLMAYRSALAVTADNIANVGTDGYRRRDVATVAAGGAQASPTTLPTMGQGVGVADVRRAFDMLATERARAATAGQAAAETHLAGARAIETLMIPGDDGIDGTMRGFFDSLAALSGNPTDTVSRSLALQSGAALTGAVSDLGHAMIGLRRDLLAEAGEAAKTAQGLLEEIGKVSQMMAGTTPASGLSTSAVHPLADRRDTLIDQLAKILPVSVTLAGDGRPTIRFGSAAGPLLLANNQSARLSVSAPDQLSLNIESPDGTSRDTRLLPTARIGGLSRAMGALDLAMQELDAFARDLAGSLNGVHRGGTDLTGAPGGDLMRHDGWKVQPAAANGGTLQVVVQPLDGPTAAPMDLRFDAGANLWRAFDTDGAEIASGAERLLVPGARIEIFGRAVDGDRVALVPTSGRAIDLRMAVTDPLRLATAAAFATTAAPSNMGTASLTVTTAPDPAAPVAGLAGLLAPGPANVPAGVVGLIPAGTPTVTLANLGQPATTTLPMQPGATLLRLTLDGAAHELALPPAADAAAMVAALQSGAARTTGGQPLAALGLWAEVDAAGGIMLARAAGTPVTAELSGPTGTVAGVERVAEPAQGVVQILTRNGRHVAGAPLTAAQAAALLTPENGFAVGAVYDPSPLTTTAPQGYRGTQVGQSGPQGPQALGLAGAGLQIGPAPLPAAAPRQIALTTSTGQGATVALPEGASAALIAGRLAGALPGLEARATTTLALSEFAAGPVQFALAGANGAPLSVNAVLADGDPTPLALAINALSDTTGIRAEVSPDRSRVLLVQGEGHDIILRATGALAGGAIRVTPTSADGSPLAGDMLWDGSGTVRQSGEVRLMAPQAFGLIEGAGTQASAPVTGAGVTLAHSAAGAAATLTFADPPGLITGGVVHRMDMGGAAYLAAVPPGATGAEAAQAMARSLRAAAPAASLTGAPLTQVPPDGSLMPLRIDGADYVLRMQGGQPVVTGPEAGRISAAFDGQNRLVLSAEGVTDGRGIGVAPTPLFGFGVGQGRLDLSGQAPDPGALPATLTFDLGGQSHSVTLEAGGGLTLSPGFPGDATRDPATGALRLGLPAPADGLVIHAAPATGFGGPDAAIRQVGARLEIVGQGQPVGLTHSAEAAFGQVLELGNLPPEDLIVGATGAPSLRLAGDVGTGPAPATAGALTVEVADAETRRLVLRDSNTGHVVAEGQLDAAGQARMGGLVLHLAGTPATGDSFALRPSDAGSANTGTVLAMTALRNKDPATGSPGLIDRLTRLQSDTGVRTAAANRTLTTATAIAEASDREQAAIGAVDLDREAARLLELQQAYQASAQAIGVARDLFDTLLRMF